MSAPSLHKLLNEAIAHLPALSRELLNNSQDALDARPQHFALQDAWRRVRGRFAADFEQAALPLLQAAGLGTDPLQRRSPGLDGLSLVDERQVLQDVAIAHVIQVIEDASGPELHQLSNLFAALRGTARARKNENPLRAALFAQALLVALSSVELDPQHRHDLMRVIATPLAQGLQRIYATLCARLREAELSQLVSSHAARAEDHDIAQRIAQGRRRSEPATLDGLARRVQEHNTRPRDLPASAAQTQLSQLFKAGPNESPDVLSRLYEQILADPRLLPALKALLARLQVAVVRLARHDSSLLRSQSHPTWALLNRVAAHGMAFERADDERLQEFLRFMTAQTQALIDAPLPNAAQFDQVLAHVERHLSGQAQQRSERSAIALASLEREQMRKPWRQLLREQITAQTADAPLGPQLAAFLNTIWVEVIVQAMVLHGQASAQALARIEWVDRLLASLQTPDGERALQALRQSLPELIQELRAGCDAIALSADKREPVLHELMLQHGRLLRGLPAAAAPPVISKPELSPEELLQRLLTERESQLPEHWAHTKVDRTQLPTVPMQLFEQHDRDASLAAVANWMARQRVGNWYHLFIQGEWLTAQIAWISDSQQFYLFIGQDADQRHSLTRGAIERLLANGLITALDDDSLVQHAVETLMQDLRDR